MECKVRVEVIWYCRNTSAKHWQNETLLTDKEHIIDIFSEAKTQTPLFNDLLENEFEKKQIKGIKDGSTPPNTCFNKLIIDEYLI